MKHEAEAHGAARDPSAGLENRVVSLSEFPWEQIPTHAFGNALADLLEVALQDAPESAGALARALEGFEFAWAMKRPFTGSDRARLLGLVGKLEAHMHTHASTDAADWLSLCVEAMQMTIVPALQTGRSSKEIQLFIRAGRLTLECFCAGRAIYNHSGSQASCPPISEHRFN